MESLQKTSENSSESSKKKKLVKKVYVKDFIFGGEIPISLAAIIYKKLNDNNELDQSDILHTSKSLVVANGAVGFMPVYKEGAGLQYLIDVSLADTKWFRENLIEDVNCHYSSCYLKDSLNDALIAELSTVNKFSTYEEYFTNRDFLKTMQIKKIPITYRKTYGKKYSFGVELETCCGFIPHHEISRLYTSCVYDGSLKDELTGKAIGGEYVTTVLQGDQGLKELAKICRSLSKRCEVNKKCSVHVHYGNFNFSKENIVLLYNLCCAVQIEVFVSLLKNERNQNKYCKPLSSLPIDIPETFEFYKEYIEEAYSKIQSFVYSTKDTANYNKKTDHKFGKKCGYNTDAARYYWVNFVTAMHNTRHNGIYTIEFRAMYGTTSYTKIKAWLLICMALLDVVENYKRELMAILTKPTGSVLMSVLTLSYGERVAEELYNSMVGVVLKDSDLESEISFNYL
jgi:hypothetical protein